MKKFNVLVACEESQAISGEIRRFATTHGYKLMAYSCDLLPTSAKEDEDLIIGPKHHLRGDAVKLLAYDETCDYVDTFIISHNTDDPSLVTHRDTLDKVIDILQQGGWDMIIANPPCTYLAVSGARWYYDTKYKEKSYHPRFPMRKVERAESIRFLMTIAMAPCKYIVIENPVGTLKSNLINGDYNIGTSPEDYVPSESYKAKFTKGLSTKTIAKRKSFRELARDLNEKKLPAWEYSDQGGLKDLKWTWPKIKLNGETEKCYSSLSWLIEPPMILKTSQAQKTESSKNNQHLPSY